MAVGGSWPDAFLGTQVESGVWESGFSDWSQGFVPGQTYSTVGRGLKDTRSGYKDDPKV